MWRDPVEETAHLRNMIEEGYTDEPMLVCDECSTVLHEDDPYWAISDDYCICEACLDVWLMDRKHFV